MKRVDFEHPKSLRDEARVAYNEGKPILADVYDALADALDEITRLESHNYELLEKLGEL